jgi:transposase InsO family protein
VEQPNKVWAGDINGIATDEGWLFLAVVIDLFSRQVVGLSLRAHMARDLITRALRMAWFKRHPSKKAGLIFHGNRGSQSGAKDFSHVLAEYGITSSRRHKCNCWDKACSRVRFGSLKVEQLHGQRFKTQRHAMGEFVAWMLWYNRNRSHSRLADVNPMRFEKTGSATNPGTPLHVSAMEVSYEILIPGERSVVCISKTLARFYIIGSGLYF